MSLPSRPDLCIGMRMKCPAHAYQISKLEDPQSSGPTILSAGARGRRSIRMVASFPASSTVLRSHQPNRAFLSSFLCAPICFLLSIPTVSSKPHQSSSSPEILGPHIVRLESPPCQCCLQVGCAGRLSRRIRSHVARIIRWIRIPSE